MKQEIMDIVLEWFPWFAPKHMGAMVFYPDKLKPEYELAVMAYTKTEYNQMLLTLEEMTEKIKSVDPNISRVTLTCVEK